METYSMHEIAMFLRCPKKFEFSVVRNWEPLVPSENIQVGAYFHNLVAHRTDLVGLIAPPDNDEEQYTAAYDMARRYDLYVGVPHNALHVEEELEFTLWEGHIRFRPDLVYEEAGWLVVRDYKTLDRIPSADDRAEDTMDFQVLMYLLGMTTLYPERKVMFEYEFARRAIPRDPEITKEGKVSRAKITTTRERYEAALQRNGEPTIGNKLLDELPRERDYFGRQRLVKTRKELTAFIREVSHALEAIRLHREHNLFQRSVIKTGGERCSSCQYFIPCSRELFDGKQLDKGEIQMLGYKQREVRNVEEGSA